MKSFDLAVAVRSFGASILVAILLVATLAPAAAGEVRLGKNVHIGGHDFSNQTFDSKHRARIYLYDRKPQKEGCAWRSDGHGGRVKICHLQRK
ncbi:hypothetical protein PH547_04275 [Rhizobium sp. CNPSo 3464]|uniref:hypothetical protein n=1 Tax=Rhizobium sp. CNPSo 3464 TaxID=3021406 RepID=UPI00254F4E32|nr:hypothetical protein [Rhizobium sp. CNPSo 3464]MDK4738081.1 hypothetical protein [Rhizobium sp. CNPSo 3464]